MTVELNGLKMSTGTTLPHVMPYLSLFTNINQKMIFKTVYQHNFESDDPNQLAQYTLTYFHEENVQTFRSNVESMISNVMFDKTLLDLFRTEYHIRLHWGSQSRFILLCSENSDERHEEFEKVITTLFEMCSMQHMTQSI